jgi:hypothetical protein
MNTQKGFSTILIVVIGLLVIGGGIYVLKPTDDKRDVQKEQEQSVKESTENNLSEENKSEEVKKVTSKSVKETPVGTCGLTIDSHKPNDVVDWPIIISGKVSTLKSSEDCAWQTFENVSGNARLYVYEDETWRPVGQSLIFNPVFSLNFNYTEIGLRMNNPIKVVFTEENPSAKRPSLVFELPLVLK